MPNTTLLLDKIKVYKDRMAFLKKNTRSIQTQPVLQPFPHHSDSFAQITEFLDDVIKYGRKIRLLDLPKRSRTKLIVTAHLLANSQSCFISERFESRTVSDKVYIHELTDGIKVFFHNAHVELLQAVTEGGTKSVIRVMISDHFFVKGQPLLRFADGTIYHAKDHGYVSGPIQNLLMNVLNTPVQHLPFLVYIAPD